MIKLLYLVFTVVITFEGTKGNVDPGSSIPIKHEREVLPTSLLFLLKRRPTSGLGYKKITPVSPIPLSPPPPVDPFGPLPPSTPAIPAAPVSPQILYSPEAPDVQNTGTRPKSFYPTIQYGQNYQQATQTYSSGQLSYDNPLNGNRKILNVVHIHPRPPPVPISRQTSQPTLPETPTTNPDNNVTEKSKDLSTNSFQINPRDIPFAPVKNIEASPIPVKPQNTEVVPLQAPNVDSETKENKDLDESKNSFQINPKDIPVEPVQNIEASPIPVKPTNTRVVPSQATNVESGIKENKDLDKSTNSFEFNPKDIPYEPIVNIEASPIPVKPKHTEVVPLQTPKVDNETKENEDLDESRNSFQINPKDIPVEPVQNIEVSPIPVNPKDTEVVPLQATKVDNETKENKDLDKSTNSFEFNPEDIPFKPVNNIEASPIPVQPKITGIPSQATDVNSASPIAEKPEEGKKPDLISSAGNNEANATPLKSQIKPEFSEEKAAVPDSINTPDAASASEHNIADKGSKKEEPQNPLKDLILNGNSSSKNEENNGQASEGYDDNLNKESTESEPTSYETPTGTHSASTNDESRYTSLSEGSAESTEPESEATSSDNTQQSTDSQSENSSTNSNTESSSGPTSEETESENTQNKVSETNEGSSSADSPKNCKGKLIINKKFKNNVLFKDSHFTNQ